MTATKPETVLVIGASPFALLLAGLLAADHSRAVVVAAPPAAARRHIHGVALSAGLQTRPETWAVLNQSAPETARRLSRLAPGAVRRADPIFAARGSAALVALQHMRHVAAGSAHPVEPVSLAPGDATQAFRLRDALMADTDALATPLLAWLETLGVKLVEDTGLLLRRDGSGQIGDHAADTAILAGDDAAITHLGNAALSPAAAIVPMRRYITEPAPAFSADAVIRPDLGVTIVARSGGALDILAEDTGGLAEARVAAALPEGLTVRRAAEIRIAALRAPDAAPLIGPARRGGPIILAGLGPQALFFAPVLARMICGTASGLEASWCTQRSPLSAQRGTVAEFGAAS